MKKEQKNIKIECPKCGSTQFIVHEGFQYQAFDNGEGVIDCYLKNSVIDLIECAKCFEDLTSFQYDFPMTFS